MPHAEGEGYQRYLALIEQIKDEGVPIQTTKMFGMPNIRFNGKAVGGFYEDSLVVKLSGQELQTAFALPGVTHFDPLGGRPMKQWLVIPPARKDEWYNSLMDAINCAV